MEGSWHRRGKRGVPGIPVPPLGAGTARFRFFVLGVGIGIEVPGPHSSKFHFGTPTGGKIHAIPCEALFKRDSCPHAADIADTIRSHRTSKTKIQYGSVGALFKRDYGPHRCGYRGYNPLPQDKDIADTIRSHRTSKTKFHFGTPGLKTTIFH